MCVKIVKKNIYVIKYANLKIKADKAVKAFAISLLNIREAIYAIQKFIYVKSSVIIMIIIQKNVIKYALKKPGIQINMNAI